MIYKNGHKVIPYKGDYQPIKLYRDGHLISSAKKTTDSGKSLSVFSEFKSPLVTKLNGNTDKVLDKSYKAGEIAGYSFKYNQLLSISTTTSTENHGVTFTNNGDGTLKINGTCDSDCNFNISSLTTTNGHKYIVISGNENVRITNTQTWSTTKGSYIFTANSDSTINIKVYAKNNDTYSNEIIIPQVADLTDMFGEGNEPTTLAQFLATPQGSRYNSYVPYGYHIGNAGECKVNQLVVQSRIPSSRSGISFTYNEGDETISVSGSATASSTVTGWLEMAYTSATYGDNLKKTYGHKLAFIPVVVSGSYIGGFYFGMYGKSYISVNSGSAYIITNDTDINSTSSSANISYIGWNDKLVPSNLKIRLLCVDLTDIYGYGNEPTTIDQIRATRPDLLTRTEYKAIGTTESHIFTDDLDIPLSEPLRESDSLITDVGVRRKKAQYTFTGSETWTYYEYGENSFWYTHLPLTSDKYAKNSDTPLLSNSCDCSVVNNTQIRVYLRVNPTITTSTDMNTIFPSGTIIEYELATPTLTPLKTTPSTLTYAKDGYKDLTLSNVREAGDYHLESVESVVNETENIFDLELEVGTIKAGDGLDSDNNTRLRGKGYVECEPNKEYTFGYSTTISGTPQCIVMQYTDNKEYLGTTGWMAVSKYTFTTKANAKYLRFIFQIGAITMKTSYIKDVYVVEGKLPHFSSKTELYVDSGNLWDEEWEVGSINSSGNLSSNGTIRSKNFISVKPSTAYYFSSTTGYNAFFYNESKQYLESVYKQSNTTFTTPSECKYIRFRMSDPNYGNTYNNDIAIYEGSTSRPYYPHGKTKPIFLNGTDYVRFGKGKNLFSGNPITATEGSLHISFMGKASYTNVETNGVFLKKGTYYIQRWNLSGGDFGSSFYYAKSGDTSNTYKTGNDSFILELNEDAKVLIWSYKSSGYSAGKYALTICEGGYLDSYEPYCEKAMLHREYGEVDLGELDWTLRSDLNSAFAQVPLMKLGSPDCICDKYQMGTGGGTSTSDSTKLYTNYQNNYLYIGKGIYLNATELKNSLNGVKLIYELATPTNESVDLDPPITCPNVETTCSSRGVIEAEWWEAE